MREVSKVISSFSKKNKYIRIIPKPSWICPSDLTLTFFFLLDFGFVFLVLNLSCLHLELIISCFTLKLISLCSSLTLFPVSVWFSLPPIFLSSPALMSHVWVSVPPPASCSSLSSSCSTVKLPQASIWLVSFLFTFCALSKDTSGLLVSQKTVLC